MKRKETFYQVTASILRQKMNDVPFLLKVYLKGELNSEHLPLIGQFLQYFLKFNYIPICLKVKTILRLWQDTKRHQDCKYQNVNMPVNLREVH